MPKTQKIALILGDGAAPEMMRVACRVAEKAATLDGIDIEWVETPMGWNAFRVYGDTYPYESRAMAKRLGIVFFGGVGDPVCDEELGAANRDMMPETRALLGLRKDLGLLINVRPLLIPYALRHLARVRPETIPATGIWQVWMRFLQEDGYFGTRDLINSLPEDVCEALGVKLKADVTGDEDMVTELAYFSRDMIVTYARYAFAYARAQGLPALNIHKANILARSLFWKKVVDGVHADEFPDVGLSDLYIDAAMSMLYEPATFNAVMLGGNEHLDFASDGALGAFSMGMMCSSAVNPKTGASMFESGAGTAPTLAGQDKANPLGRILTAAMMLRHIGAHKGANAINLAVDHALKDGWRTADLGSAQDEPDKIIGTKAMGDRVIACL